MHQTTVDWKAHLLDLERRTSLLEIRNYGHATPLCGEALLVHAYLDAHKAAQLREPVACRAFVRSIYLLDVRALVRIGRAVRDNYPWRPFLAALDLYCRRQIEGGEEAREHLLSISTELLQAMGLELLQPRDVMGSLRLEDALNEL